MRLAVYLKALACNFKRMVHARLVEMENTASAGCRDGTCGRGRMRAPLHKLPPGALSHGRGTATGSRLS